MSGRGACKIARRWQSNAIVAALALLLLAHGPALATTPECGQLAAQLERLKGTGGLDGLANSTAQAGDQIDDARIRAAELGCDRAISGDMISVCAALNADIARMQDNLERPRPPSADTRRERVRILDAMELAGCNDPDAEEQEAEQAPDAGQFGGTIIRGGSSETVEVGSGYPQRIVVGRTGPQIAGEYRTLCVRTCDGYTFPLSSIATVSDFQRDQKSCEAGCPGTEVALYYHLADGETQDDMVSARSGQPYRQLPTAYRHKRTDLPRVPACGCNIGQNQNSNFSIIAGEGRPVPSAPKTMPTIEAPVPGANLPGAVPDPDRKVRAVGPAFLPDPEGAAGLQVPAPTQGR